MSSGLEATPILSLCLEQWGDVWRNRHHIMLRLAKVTTVLFASAPFYIRDAYEDIRQGTGSRTGLAKVNERLYTYVPPRWLPYNYRYMMLDRAVERLRFWHMKRAMATLRMKNPILYIWHPSLVDITREFEESLVVYHCYDEHVSFTDQTESEKKRVMEQERQLLERAAIVFAASEELYERKRQFNPNVHLVRNAVDYSLFAKAQETETQVPAEIRSIPGPVIACVATQTPYMDLELLRKVFTLRPNWSFVFIGVERPNPRTAGEELLAFQNLPNVYFIGPRRLEEMPGYLKGCDVCVIPWILNDVTLVSSSPLKLYEYLAAGKPVVCKPLPLISHLHDVISFAIDANEWITAIENALRNDRPEKIEQRQALARQNTWDQRAYFISCKLAEELSPSREGHFAFNSSSSRVTI